MKQTYALFLLLAAAPSFSTAQNLLTITDETGVDVTNGTVVHEMAATDWEAAISLTTLLNGSSSMMVNVKRYELSYAAGSENYFCWNECYSPTPGGDMPFWDSPDPKGLTAGAPFYGFHAYYKPNGTAGSAVYRYVWYAVSNPDDTVYVDINFNATATGIAEHASAVLGFTAWPNPANGADVTLNYELSSITPGTRLAVYNVLGERKLVMALKGVAGKVVLHSGELGSGIWFATLERDGRALATKRVVVLD